MERARREREGEGEGEGERERERESMEILFAKQACSRLLSFHYQIRKPLL
jgi:hypothetical protein